MKFDDRHPDYSQLLSLLGLNLAKPNTVEHFFYFPTQEAATRAAKQLQSEGYATEASPEPNEPDWFVLAVGEAVLAEGKIVEVSAHMEALADKFGGKYDGSGVPFVDKFAVSKPETRHGKN